MAAERPTASAAMATQQPVPSAALARIRESTCAAGTPDELVAAVRGSTSALAQAVAEGAPSDAVTAGLSGLIEAAVSTAVELHLRLSGPAPVPFTWLLTGSVARGEAVLASDVDTALAWDCDDDDLDVRHWMRSFATEVLTTLTVCGLSNDSNGVRADDPRFSRSVAAWRTAVQGWAAEPWQNQADVYLSAVTDARAVRGATTWEPVTDAVRAAFARPLVRTTMLRVATALHPATGLLRGLVTESAGEHSGTLDLKQGGAAPAVATGRYLATMLPSPAAGTADRVQAAAARGLLRTDDAHALVDALAVVQQVRLQHQVEQWRRGLHPDDRVQPDHLPPHRRRRLRDALRTVARVQRALPLPVARP